jgi:uncharacterized protein YqeY
MTASSLRDRVQEDMKAAMRAREKEKLDAIRLILAAIKQREIDERITLDDAQILAVLDKMLKQRRESVAQYTTAGRTDLVAQENLEIGIIQSYLPTPLSDTEINTMIDRCMTETGATSARDMGKVMGMLKPELQGRADIAAVSARVKERLGG